MVHGWIDQRIGDVGAFPGEGCRGTGNAGCAASIGLAAFQRIWQRPFQPGFSDRVCIDAARLPMGAWAAAFGRQEAIQTRAFMGGGGRKTARYPREGGKDLGGRIVDNR
jgi:hypothetical protein